MANQDTRLRIEFESFNEGLSPLAHIDDLTFRGNRGQARKIKADIVSLPGYIVQSPGLSDLDNGNQTGVVDELIRFILDEPTGTNTTFAVGASKLFKLSSTAVIGSNVCTQDQEYTGNNTNLYFGTTTAPRCGQQFTAGKDGKVCKVTVNLGKAGTPTDNVSLAIYDLDGDDKPDNLLGTADNVVAGDDIPALFGEELFDFNFANGPTLVSGTKYAVVLLRSGSNDDSNYYAPYAGSGSLYPGGDSLTFDGSAWSINPSLDLYFVQSTNVSWPKVVNGMTAGESIVKLNDDLLIFFNTAVEGDIATLNLNTEELIWNWGSVTDQPLEKVPHPSAVKEDRVVFGNGRYLGVLIQGLNVLDVQKIDFGAGAEVADVVFNSNLWWIAVNYHGGARSRVFVYDGAAITNYLSDEVGVGKQKIGFLYVFNGIVYVAFEDKTASGGFAIGWLSGRQLRPLRYFKGSLPNFQQKTVFKNTIIFLSQSNIYSFGAVVEQLPIQISVLRDTGYNTPGALAAPFGTPLIASTDGTTNFRLAKFNGLDDKSSFDTVVSDSTEDRSLANIHTVIVYTKTLTEGARAAITLKCNQGDVSSNNLIVEGVGKTRHVFRTISLQGVWDISVNVDYTLQSGSPVLTPIRKIVLLGNFTER